MSMLRNKFSLSRYVPRRTCFFLAIYPFFFLDFPYRLLILFYIISFLRRHETRVKNVQELHPLHKERPVKTNMPRRRNQAAVGELRCSSLRSRSAGTCRGRNFSGPVTRRTDNRSLHQGRTRKDYSWFPPIAQKGENHCTTYTIR